MEDIKAGRVYSADEVEAEMKQEFGIWNIKWCIQPERIMTAIRKLDTMPNRNRLYEEEPWYSRGLRFFPVDNYLVFYKTDDETETVYVVRIMYGGRDVQNS